MKSIIKFLFSALFLTALVSSCKKEENKVYFEGGTNPVLKSSVAAALTLTRANADNQAVVFSWSNPDYKFNTGVSSQDVSYVMQIDTTGANFMSSNLQEISIARELSKALTVKDLNTILTKLLLNDGQAYNVEFRIKATLANGLAVPLYSNVIKLSIIPYLDVAIPVPTTNALFITGDGTPSGWTNAPPTAQKCVRVSLTEYNVTMSFQPGKYYKFLSNLSQWQPQYGLKAASGGDATGGILALNDGTGSDPDAIPTPAIAGNYKVTLNFRSGKYTVVKL
jgi:hypothetical protein